MSKLEFVRRDADRLRVSAWRGDGAFAQITPSPAQPPSPSALERCLRSLAERGYQGVFTSALSLAEQAPFVELGFTVHERLRLLRYDLERRFPSTDPGIAPLRVRRARRGDRTAALEIDAAAFSPFWQFDHRSLVEARDATPASRFRVADLRPSGREREDLSPSGREREGLRPGGQRREKPSSVVGYAITGRAGNVGYLQRLAVDPAAQGQGIGAALVADALRWARRHRATTALVNTQETNHRALRFYQHLGFEPEVEGLAVLHRGLDPDGAL